MVEAALAVALLLLAGGILGSVLPVVPSGLLSLAGLAVYTLFGRERIGALWLTSMVLAAVIAVALEVLAGPIAARASGASTRTALVATLGGIALFVVAGPVGILLGMVAGVFLLELRRGTATGVAARRSVLTAAGLLGASALQALLTAAVLLAFVVSVVL